MKPTVYFTLCLLSLWLGCSENDNTEITPSCITEKINAIKKEDVRNPPTKFYRYQYQGKSVYFFPQHCCDFFSELYEDDCTLICAPDGGITGMGDGKCSDFFTERSAPELIWEDDRK